jgi:hypothetical protein
LEISSNVVGEHDGYSDLLEQQVREVAATKACIPFELPIVVEIVLVVVFVFEVVVGGEVERGFVVGFGGEL